MVPSSMLQFGMFADLKIGWVSSEQKLDFFGVLWVLSVQIHPNSPNPVSPIKFKGKMLGKGFMITTEPDEGWVPK